MASEPTPSLIVSDTFACLATSRSTSESLWGFTGLAPLASCRSCWGSSSPRSSYRLTVLWAQGPAAGAWGGLWRPCSSEIGGGSSNRCKLRQRFARALAAHTKAQAAGLADIHACAGTGAVINSSTIDDASLRISKDLADAADVSRECRGRVKTLSGPRIIYARLGPYCAHPSRFFVRVKPTSHYET